jgi:hypothetical protein
VYTVNNIWINITVLKVAKNDLVLLQGPDVFGHSFNSVSKIHQTANPPWTCNCALCSVTLEPIKSHQGFLGSNAIRILLLEISKDCRYSRRFHTKMFLETKIILFPPN